MVTGDFNVLICRRNCTPTTSDDLWLTPFYTVSDISRLGSQKPKNIQVWLPDYLTPSAVELPVAAYKPRWNSIPDTIDALSILLPFQHSLKTLLFLYFNNPLCISIVLVDSPTQAPNDSSTLSHILRYRCTNIPHRQTHTRTQCMLYPWYFRHEKLTNVAEHRVINDWTASRPRKRRERRWEPTGAALRARTHCCQRDDSSYITAPPSLLSKSEIRQHELRSKRRVYAMFYCTEINVRTVQLAHETDERTKVEQTKTSLIYLSHVTHHTLIQEIRKLNLTDSADRVSPNTRTARRMRL